jgi:hypothetical protein
MAPRQHFKNYVQTYVACLSSKPIAVAECRTDNVVVSSCRLAQMSLFDTKNSFYLANCYTSCTIVFFHYALDSFLLVLVTSKQLWLSLPYRW